MSEFYAVPKHVHLPLSSRLDKSTNVRALERSLGHLRAFFSTVGPFFPDAAGSIAERLFLTPPRPSPSPRIAAALAAGTPLRLRFNGAPMAAWSWGQGPAVLLVHGWGGLGGQFASFATALAASGFRAVAFDGPAHGASAGSRSSLVELARAIAAVAWEVGPLHGLVAHSMGASSSAVAMEHGFDPGRAVFLGPASDPGSATYRFGEVLGLTPTVLARLRARVEARVGVPMNALYVPRIALGMRAPLKVFHDLEDAEVPWTEGSSIAAAWPGAELITTRGLGHNKILHDAEVIRRTVEFMQQERIHARAA